MSLKLFTILLMLGLSACSTIRYYGQSVQGQLHILFSRESLDQVIENPNTSVELRRNLQQAKIIRQYASNHLALPENKSYLYYVDLKRPYVVWNVFAAPEFSLSPISWCYPLIGCVSYRGYFSKNDALREAEQLEASNLDVAVAGIAAYSTLGWFNDPLLNTMLHWQQRTLAGLIFHELSHQIIYIKNETSFNEAFATSVERLGTIQWLLESLPDQIDNYLIYLSAQSDFRALLLETRKQLDNLYKSPLNNNKKRKQKESLITRMKLDYQKLKQKWPKHLHFDAWFSKPVNNARLTSAMTYLHDIPAFFQIFIEEKGRWPEYYRHVSELENLSPEKRKSLITNKASSAIDYVSIIKLIKGNIEPK